MSRRAPMTMSANNRARSGPSLAALCLLVTALAANTLFALSLVPPRVLFGREPIADIDYALHFSRAAASDELFKVDGRTWGYDPHFMAGYPMGTVFDVNNKGVEVAVVALHRLGPSVPASFNLLVFLTAALPAFAIWLTSRNFGLSMWQQSIATTLALALWVIDREIGTDGFTSRAHLKATSYLSITGPHFCLRAVPTSRTLRSS